MIILKRLKNEHPKTYFSYTLINLKVINTIQVWSVNLVLFNILLKFMYEKKR